MRPFLIQVNSIPRFRLKIYASLRGIFAGLFLLFCVAPIPCTAQKAEKLSQVKKLYVGSLGQSRRADELRARLIHHLEHEHEIHIVDNPANADALLKGSGQIWTTGEVSLSPHSNSANEAVLEGYLSIEIVGKSDQTLWSYLATPSKFPWGGIADNLARQAASRLGEDIRRSATRQESPASPETGGRAAVLKAAGASFPAPLYQKWFQSFEELHPEVQITYEVVGSGEGIRRIGEGEVDFGASDMPLSEEALAGAHHRFLQVPMVLGAVVPIYNLPGLHGKMRFTPEILAGIYLGTIRTWNDPKIRSANPGVALAENEIAVIHRSDASGTSFVWTDYLSKISPQWKSSVGSGVTVQWPVGKGATYNEGVAEAVEDTPNSIGYVEMIYAIQHELSFARVRNAAGEYIKADLASVTEAARTSGSPDRGFRLSITDAPGKFAYPITTYTWLLIPEQNEDANKNATLRGLIDWMLSSGQKSCSALGYAPLPADVARSAQQSVERVLQNSTAQR